MDSFQKILSESGRKPNKMWVNKDSKFYMNDIEMYSTHNEGKSDVTEWFRTLKIKSANIWLQNQKICILMNWVSNEFRVKRYNK